MQYLFLILILLILFCVILPVFIYALPFIVLISLIGYWIKTRKKDVPSTQQDEKVIDVEFTEYEDDAQ
ncbi:hypothetical protein [Floccifex sp.]|uniref:hypothetical protein n=1 Tax=Floccifex sp. TaxID=2815810 RepID=UPI003F0A54E0